MDCFKKCRNRRNSQTFGLQSLALGSLSFARAHADITLKKIEEKLEKEIQRESEEHYTLIAKLRHNGEKFLNSKVVLLIIVALNMLDCVLVLGELILDINYIVGILDTTEKTSRTFIESMQAVYNNTLQNVNSIGLLYKKLLSASIYWDSPAVSGSGHSLQRRGVEYTDGYLINSTATTVFHSPFLNQTTPKFVSVHDYEHEHSIEELIAHGFHKASIAILTVLVLETLVKVFCAGTRIFEKKLEVFDGVVVVISFVLDLVFIKGLTMFKIQDYVFILAILVPWRVIRVVNSLVVAVMGHGHFRLKMLYHQKKQVSSQLKQEKKENKILQNCVATLMNMCIAEGMDEMKVKGSIDMFQPSKKTQAVLRKKSDNNSTIGSVNNYKYCTIKEVPEKDDCGYKQIHDKSPTGSSTGSPTGSPSPSSADIQLPEEENQSTTPFLKHNDSYP